MKSKTKKIVLLMIYLLGPIIASIFYWFEEPVQVTLESQSFLTNLRHNIASILGIFSFIWMCFNIIIMVKIKMMEKNVELDWLIKFHMSMALIALFFGILHAPLLLLQGTYDDAQINSGLIGLIIFLVLIVIAIVFMTNRLINFKPIRILRLLAYKMKFRYNVNKILHNISVFAVIVIFFHSLMSYTAAGSMIMRIVYFFFFIIMIISWVSHKFVRRMRLDTDPYIHRKFSWDNNIFEIQEKLNNKWTAKIIKRFPSLYSCIQCGICTSVCPVSTISRGDFNPRKIIKCLSLGLKKKMLDEVRLVWECKQCNLCTQNCPQHIEFPEIVIYIRDILTYLNQKGRTRIPPGQDRARKKKR